MPLENALLGIAAGAAIGGATEATGNEEIGSDVMGTPSSAGAGAMIAGPNAGPATLGGGGTAMIVCAPACEAPATANKPAINERATIRRDKSDTAGSLCGDLPADATAHGLVRPLAKIYRRRHPRTVGLLKFAGYSTLRSAEARA